MEENRGTRMNRKSAIRIAGMVLTHLIDEGFLLDDIPISDVEDIVADIIQGEALEI